MEVKIDTKEKFHVITPLEPELSANLTENLRNMMHGFLEKPVRNIVLNLASVDVVDEAFAKGLPELQKAFYDRQASFVVCCLKPAPKALLEDLGSLERLNFTPTESEAWDIVQMEEIEREIFGEESQEL